MRAYHSVTRGNSFHMYSRPKSSMRTTVGMMLMSEVARKEGLFDWLAGIAVRTAKGSATRLFTLVYLVGTVVTVFLSNDACAVVLTPAVYAATRAAKVENPFRPILR